MCHFITLHGHVFSCGYGGDGQLGFGGLLTRPYPKRVMSFVDQGAVVVFAAAGDGHSLFLTNRGRVYVVGAGEEGQLGHGGPRDEDHLFGAKLEPYLLPPISSFDGSPAKIEFAAAGFAHSMLVDSSGCVYTFGDGMRGRLGHGNEHSYQVRSCFFPCT